MVVLNNIDSIVLKDKKQQDLDQYEVVDDDNQKTSPDR